LRQIILNTAHIQLSRTFHMNETSAHDGTPL